MSSDKYKISDRAFSTNSPRFTAVVCVAFCYFLTLGLLIPKTGSEI